MKLAKMYMYSFREYWRSSLYDSLELEKPFVAPLPLAYCVSPIYKVNLLLFYTKPRRRWEDNIRMHLKEIGINMRNWVDSAQDRDF